jgi:NAD(P)-dependent dehydrogenase (short-subunit alcohol dehydrogenase family)
MSGEFSGRVALVTGGAGDGIGSVQANNAALTAWATWWTSRTSKAALHSLTRSVAFEAEVVNVSGGWYMRP